jgi:hypothetical protein
VREVNQASAGVEFRNESSGFVHHVGVELIAPDRDGQVSTVRTDEIYFQELGPGQRETSFIGLGGAADITASPSNTKVKLTFTDEEGRRWSRVSGTQPDRIG